MPQLPHASLVPRMFTSSQTSTYAVLGSGQSVEEVAKGPDPVDFGDRNQFLAVMSLEIKDLVDVFVDHLLQHGNHVLKTLSVYSRLSHKSSNQ